MELDFTEGGFTGTVESREIDRHKKGYMRIESNGIKVAQEVVALVLQKDRSFSEGFGVAADKVLPILEAAIAMIKVMDTEYSNTM